MENVIREASRFHYGNGHHLNRISESVRKRVYNPIDMILRPDNGASGGVNI